MATMPSIIYLVILINIFLLFLEGHLMFPFDKFMTLEADSPAECFANSLFLLEPPANVEALWRNVGKVVIGGVGW